MYDIATGAFVRNVVTNVNYNPGGLAFNPNNSGEIIHFADVTIGISQLVRWLTSTTDVSVASNNQLASYGKGLYYSPAIAGVTVAGIFASNGGSVLAFDPTTLTYVGNVRDGLGTAGGITGTNSELYYVSSSGGYVERQTTLASFISGLSNPLGITNDGSNLFIANQGTNEILKYTTSGAFVSAFSVTNPNQISYVVPEPSTYGMLGAAGALALLATRRRKQAQA